MSFASFGAGKKLRIGIDCGGVLFPTDHKYDPQQSHSRGSFNQSNHPNDEKQAEEDTSTTTVWMEGAQDSIKQLAAQGHDLFVVSFAGKKRAIETKLALKQVEPYILAERVFIVKDRKLKGKVCKEQNIQVLIDDRQDVLDQAKKTCPGLMCILFESWTQVLETITAISHA